jgi:hypothetical protein
MSMARAISLGILVVVLGCAGTFGQCPLGNDEDKDAPPPAAPPDFLSYSGDEQILPESGYLSNHTYTSVFFGIGLDLPIEVEAHRWMLPLMPPGQHALLGLAFQEGRRQGTLMMIAAEPSNQQPQESAQQRQEDFERWAQHQPTLNRVPPDWMMRSGHFYHVSQKKGDDYTLQYSTRIRNYTIRVKFKSNDPEFIKRAKHSMEMVRIYCPNEDGTLTTEKGDPVTPEGTPYQGPTVPTARVDAKLAEKPAEHAIPDGELSDGVYRNTALGVEYALPKGWKAISQPHADTGAKSLSDPYLYEVKDSRTRDFLRACSRTLLQATGDNGSAHNGAGDPTIILRVLDPACFSLRGPNTVADHQGADELAAYLQMLNAFGQIRSSDLVSASGHVFAVYRGTIEELDHGQELPSRSAQMILATRYNKLVYLWSLIVPKDVDLKRVPASTAVLGRTDTIQLGPEMASKH